MIELRQFRQRAARCSRPVATPVSGVHTPSADTRAVAISFDHASVVLLRRWQRRPLTDNEAHPVGRTACYCPQAGRWS